MSESRPQRLRAISGKASKTRAWENEFEKAEVGEVFVRADRSLTDDANGASWSIGLTGVHYRSIGMLVELARELARQSYDEEHRMEAHVVLIKQPGPVKKKKG